MWKISIHLSPVIYLKKQLNLHDNSSRFLIMIYRSLCRPKKPLLFESTTAWIKESGDEDFEIPMGCFNGAEISELVRTHIESKLINIMNKEDVRLYHDDGLGIFKNISRPETEMKNKNIVFKNVDYQL